MLTGRRFFIRIAELLFFLALGVLHLMTWWAPRVASDEVTFADFALHHDLHLYRTLLPPDLALLSSGYAFGLAPVYMAALSFILRTWGIGIASIRMMPLVCGLVVLALLYWLMRKTQSGVWSIAGLVFFSTSTPFFLTTHTVRSESIILLIIVANVAWWLLRGPRWGGLVLGALTGLGFGIAPSVAYAVAMILLLALLDGRESRSRMDHLVLWGMGVVVGVLFVVSWMDVDQAARSFSVQQVIYRSQWIQKNALQSHSLNMLRLLNKGLSAMTQGSGPGSVYYPFLIAWLMATLLIQLRRPWSDSRSERLIVGVAAGTWVIHSVLTISPQTHAYALFFFPWWIWQSGFVLRRLFQKTLNLDWIDVALLGVCVGLFAFPVQSMAGDLLMGGALVLTLFPRREMSVLRHRVVTRWAVAGFGILAVCVILVTDQAKIPARLHQLALEQRVYQSEVAALRGEARLIGPTTLWLYDSQLNLQSLDFVFLKLPWDPTPWIVAYHPTLILWPRVGVDSLRALLVARYPRASLSIVSSWDLPATYATNFVGLRLDLHGKT